MKTVKLTKAEIETLVEVTARHCYENCEFYTWNGAEVRLFRFKSIYNIVDVSFFEILPRFAKNKDENYIEARQMDEIYKSITKKLEGDYEVFDKDDFEDALEDYEYDDDLYNWID